MSDDPIYDRFAARLADAVTVAINSGIKVSSSDKSCYCPLGCFGAHPGDNSDRHRKRPCNGTARKLDHSVEATPNTAPSDFAYIFDGAENVYGPLLDNSNGKYINLAKAYRARFP